MLDHDHKSNISFKLPVTGYISSLVLVFGAYFLTKGICWKQMGLIFFVMALAAAQVFIQLLTFLNLGIERKPRWGMMTALFTLMVIVIIFGGTLWIMKNINYNLMP